MQYDAFVSRARNQIGWGSRYLAIRNHQVIQPYSLRRVIRAALPEKDVFKLRRGKSAVRLKGGEWDGDLLPRVRIGVQTLAQKVAQVDHGRTLAGAAFEPHAWQVRGGDGARAVEEHNHIGGGANVPNLKPGAGDENDPVPSGSRFPLQQAALATGVRSVSQYEHLPTIWSGGEGHLAWSGRYRHGSVVVARSDRVILIKDHDVRFRFATGELSCDKHRNNEPSDLQRNTHHATFVIVLLPKGDIGPC